MSHATPRALTSSSSRANVRPSFLEHDGQWSGWRASRGCGTDITQRDFPDELVRHRPALERSARRLCRNRHDAEDLVQATLERALRAQAQFAPGGNLGGWLFRILCNRHRDNLRRRNGIQVALPDELPDNTPEAEEVSSLLSASPEAVLEAVKQLPPELRAPLELHAVRGKRYREIAEELSLPINTVGTRIRRARHRLQELFAAGGARQQGGGR